MVSQIEALGHEKSPFTEKSSRALALAHLQPMIIAKFCTILRKISETESAPSQPNFRKEMSSTTAFGPLTDFNLKQIL